ncbi:MAG: aminoglycoside phosphotransferase family protein [Bacteroidota bacterium]
MSNFINTFLQQVFNKPYYTYHQIEDLGVVNTIYEINGIEEDYILRFNTTDASKTIEYKKEKWCLEQVAKLGIPSPKVLDIGVLNGVPYQLMNKLPGVNGSLCTADQKAEIWEKLGTYTAIFQQIKKMEVEEVLQAEFHKDWKARLHYNIKELHSEDSLLINAIFTEKEHNHIKYLLKSLIGKNFKTGLCHEDLSPRNVMYDEGTIYLLDWGLGEINIVPHTEIGVLATSGDATDEYLHLFLKGLGISDYKHQNIKEEINLLNLLHRLDKYRWAEGNAKEIIGEYERKVRMVYDEITLS